MSSPITKPVRLQLSRAKGFELQAASIALNGLRAINVARPSKWGNPYKVGAELGTLPNGQTYRMTAADCVRRYREHVRHWMWKVSENTLSPAELSGKNLACWCKPGAPCHADVLLELANP